MVVKIFKINGMKESGVTMVMGGTILVLQSRTEALIMFKRPKLLCDQISIVDSS